MVGSPIGGMGNLFKADVDTCMLLKELRAELSLMNATFIYMIYEGMLF